MIEPPSPPPVRAAVSTKCWPRLFVIWSCIAALLIGSHLSFYFKQPYYEGGDFAANALQIRKAKVFHELYGNYSRWGFHHPGPAFFYAYAAGEGLLFDTLKVVPTPYNAHLLVGVLLQSFFFAWALAIVSKHVRRPLLVPLLLVFAGLHFGMLNFSMPDSAFESIWPPYVLLGPFLCFLVAGASVASGDATDLVPMVVAACFLVHGHVAQPLFVVPLALLAYSILASRHKGALARFLRSSSYPHLAATGIMLLFLLPIVLDAFGGRSSNLSMILAHFGKHSDDHKTFLQSFAYLASFLCYISSPEIICDRLSITSAVQLLSRWPLLLMWCLVGTLALVLPRFRAPQGDPRSRLFVHWLAIYFALACLLTIVWGTFINGQMFAFNSYFNYALLFLPFILLAIALATLPRLQHATYISRGLLIISVPLWLMTARNFTWASDFPTMSRETKTWFDQIRHAARSDKQGVPVKFLSFEHADWPWAAGVALALQRIGRDYAVSQDWAFMFDDEHVANVTETLAKHTTAFWKIRSPAVAGQDWVSYTPPSVNPAGSEISFSGPEPNAKAYVISGWDISPGPFSWSTGNSGLLYFTAVPATAAVEVEFEVFPEEFSAPKTQRISISFNDTPLQSFQVSQRSVLKLRIPSEKWNSRSVALMAFQFPDGVSPSAAGVSADPRILGCGFIRINFHLAQTSE